MEVTKKSSHVPISAKLWVSRTCPEHGRRDFRKVTLDKGDVCRACGHPRGIGLRCGVDYSEWTSSDLQATDESGTKWEAKVDQPEKGWAAFMVEFQFRNTEREG